ncbi:hypothetical protein RJ639_003097 [Escallonia herrerae]|uniref:Uncharacterized protein n=1 Tax=Escallonia herrerae TaxID=1293975 RepID=A0AA88VYE9_9ASTE|nr:hypothetical protein RJ639_003097 [Escallonia herrerae]
MDPTFGDGKHELNRKLYDALLKEDKDKVIELCQNIPEGPLHVLTIHDDTVLHMATYSKQDDLVCKLLGMLSEHNSDKLMHQNKLGNTILHEAAISEDSVPAAKIMLHIAPKLLSVRNNDGETALFRAASYGRKTMFEFLDSEVNKRAKLSESDLLTFHRRNDKTTILHVSIICMHFGISTEDTTTKTGEEYPCGKLFEQKKRKYRSAVPLAEFLTGKDTSWEATESTKGESNPTTHMHESSSTVLQHQDHVGSREKSATGDEIGTEDTLRSGNPPKSPEMNKNVGTPLMLATRHGCTNNVEAILRNYPHPQAVEYIDGEGRNI